MNNKVPLFQRGPKTVMMAGTLGSSGWVLEYYKGPPTSHHFIWSYQRNKFDRKLFFLSWGKGVGVLISFRHRYQSSKYKLQILNS